MFQNNIETTPRSRNYRIPFRQIQNYQIPFHAKQTMSYNNSYFNEQQLCRDFTRSLCPQQLGRYNNAEKFAVLSDYINPQTQQARHALLAHYERERVQKSEDSYKTVMCQNWLASATCGFGKKCRFAHGEHELRQPKFPIAVNEKYKTRICQKYNKGICPFGANCLFIHENVNGCDPTPPMASFDSLVSSDVSTNKFCADYALKSPFDLSQHSFSSSLPTIEASSQLLHNIDSSVVNEPLQPRKNKNLLPQLQQQLLREKRKKSIQEMFKKHDRLLASSEKKKLKPQSPITPRSSKRIISTTSPSPSSAKLLDPFAANIETYIDTITNVLDNSDIPE